MNKDSPLILGNILNFVCARLNLKVIDVKGRSRKAELVIARKYYAKIANDYTKETLENIGKEINRGHDDIIYYNTNLNDYIEMGDRSAEKFPEILEGCSRMIKQVEKVYGQSRFKWVNTNKLRTYLCTRFTTHEIDDIIKNLL